MSPIKTAWVISSLVLLLTACAPAYAKRLHYEKVYQQTWCDAAGGKTEQVQSDRTRVDCLTDQFAVEVDFADKWAEGIDQSQHYSKMTGKAPAVLLIVEQQKQLKFLTRLCQKVAAVEPLITVFVAGPAAPQNWQGCPQ